MRRLFAGIRGMFDKVSHGRMWLMLTVLIGILLYILARQTVNNIARTWWPFMATAILLVIIIACVMVFPSYIVTRSMSKRNEQHLELVERLKAENDVRTTLLQAVGGALLLAGAFFTWQQLQVSREGQITDRFTKAIEQLGNKNLDVRLGGIYALERIAKDSRKDRAAIEEVLTAYVREHSPWSTTTAQASSTRNLPSLQARAPDIQAVITVLGRRHPSSEAKYEPFDPDHALVALNLSGVDLRNADLRGGNFAGANFSFAHLEGTNLFRAHLERADFAGVHAERAIFVAAQLDEAFFAAAHLEGAHLNSADLRGANLSDADLSAASLTDAKLEGATANVLTTWPEGFDWGTAGVQNGP